MVGVIGAPSNLSQSTSHVKVHNAEIPDLEKMVMVENVQ